MKHPRLRRLLLFGVAVVAMLAPTAGHAAAQHRPNVVLLIADDLGWPHTGFMGHPYVQTPNIDALAAGGTVFTHAQNLSSVCEGSLRTLLAGVHSDQWDAKRIALESLLGRQPTRAEVAHYRTLPRDLSRRGYLSWEGGKMWEGTYALAGFTAGTTTGIGGPLFSIGETFGRDGWSEGTELAPLQGFLDQVGEQPFFLWVAPMLPHTPLNAPDEFHVPYRDLGLPLQIERYYANVSWLDAFVGAVVAELDTRGLREDTVILFVSDNGIDEVYQYAGLGKGKGTLYELGFRTPLIVNWPGKVPSGVMRDDLISTLDVAPTILDYAGADTTFGRGGRSLKGAVESGSPIGRDLIVSGYGGAAPHNSGYYARTPSWRYLAAIDGSEELYAITTDPFETTDLAAAHPELLPGFRADVLDWVQESTTAPAELEVGGRLIDEHGQPIAGEQLLLAGKTSAKKPLRLRVATSANGDFLFTPVPLGRYLLSSSRGSAKLTFAGRRGRIPVVLPVGPLGSYVALNGIAPKSPRVSGESTVSGVVRDHLGRPIPGALVSLSGNAPARLKLVVRTSPDGRYRAESLPEDTYRVTVVAGPHVGHALRLVHVARSDDATLDLTTTGS